MTWEEYKKKKAGKQTELSGINETGASESDAGNASSNSGAWEKYKARKAERADAEAEANGKEYLRENWNKNISKAMSAAVTAEKQYNYASAPENSMAGKLYKMIHSDDDASLSAVDAAKKYSDAKAVTEFYDEFPTYEGYMNYVALRDRTAALEKEYTEEAGRAAWDEIAAEIDTLKNENAKRSYMLSAVSGQPDSVLPAIDPFYKDTNELYRTSPGDEWSDEEKYRYAYLKKNGGDWQSYAKLLNQAYAAQSQEREKNEHIEFADSFGGAALTTAENVILSGTYGLADYINDIIDPEYKKYSKYMTPFDSNQAGVSAISEKLNAKAGTIDESVPLFGGKGLGDAYQLVNSILQSAFFGAVGAATGTQVVTFISFFGQAAASGIEEAKAKGATDGEALAYGTLAGVFEGLFEELSLDKVIKLNNSPAGLKELISNVLKSAGIEASEEMATTTANKIADAVILGEMSDLSNETLLKNIEDILWDGVAGAISGGVHSGGMMTANYVWSNSNAERTERAMLEDFGKNIGLNESGVSALVDGYVRGNDVSEYAEEFMKYYDAGRQGTEIPSGEGIISENLRKIAYNEGKIKAIEEEGQAGQNESRLSIKKSADGQIYVDIDTDERFNGLSDTEKAALARKIIKEKFAGKVVGEKGRAFVNGNSAEHYSKYPKKYDSATIDAKMRAANEIDNILDAGTNFRNEADGADGHTHSDVVGGFDKFDVIFKVGGDYYSGVINIKNNKQGKLFYDVTKIKNTTQDIYGSYGDNPKSTFLNDVSKDIIPESEKNVKGNSEKFKAGNIGVAFKGESRAVYESGNASSADYSAAFAEAYKNGYLGRGVGTSFDGIRAKFGADIISDAQLDDAYQVGADDRSSQRGTVRRGSGKVEYNGATVSASEKAMVEELAAFGQVDIKFDDLEGANGTYKDGVIYIDKHAEHPVAVVLGHEGYHRFREASPAQAAVIERIAYEAAEKKDPDIAEKTIARYAEAGQIITYADAIEEIAADYVGDAIGTPENFRQIIKQASTQRQKNAVARLFDKIRELWNRVKAKFTGAKYEKTVSDADKAIAALEKMMYSAKIGIETEAETASEGGEKASIKKTMNMPYAKQLELIEKNELNGSNSLYVGTPGQNMQNAGLSSAPFAMNQSDYRKSRRKGGNNEHYSSHNVSLDFFEKIQENLNSAPIIIDNGERLSVITDYAMNDKNGKASFVMVGIMKNQQMENDIVNQIKSIYPLDDIFDKMTSYAKSGKIVVLNKNKAEKLLTTIGLQLSEVSNILDSAKTIISQKDEKSTGKMSLKEKYDFSKSFAEQIDDYKDGKFPENDTLVVSGTPKVFQQIGLNPLPMTYTQSHLREALENKDGEHLGESLLKEVPNALEEPIAIIDSSSRPGRLVAIIEIPNGSNKTIAAVEIDGSGKMHGLDIDSNAIVSIYEKENIYSKLLIDAIKSELSGNGGIYYWQKNKAMRNLITSGVQFPGITNLPDGFIGSIDDPLSKVNRKIENVTKTKQFKRWFGDSKVVNEDGTPKVVYHGTDAKFTVFEDGHPRKNYPAGKNLGDGFYFAPDENHAENYGERIIPAFVALKNPYVQLGHEFDYQDLKALSQKAGKTVTKTNVSTILKELGYDGVIAKSYDGKKIDTVVAFYPTQIKSATDNIGTFDGGNPDIRYSLKTSDAEKRVAELAEELERVRQSWSENGEFTGSLLPSETQLKKTVDILMDGYTGEKTKKTLTVELKELFGDIRKYRDAKTTGYKDKLWKAISPKIDQIAADLCNGRVSAEKDESGLYLYNENMPRAVLAQKLELMYSLFEMPNFVRDDMKAGTDVNKLYEKIKELRTEKEAALEKVREQRRKTVKALKLAETTDAEIDQKYYESEARKKLLRIAKRMSGIKYVNREYTIDGKKVNVGKLIDRAVHEAVESMSSIKELDVVSLGMRRSTKERLEDISSWYSAKRNKYSNDYDSDFFGDKRTEAELARLSKKQISDMSIRDVEALIDALKNVEITIRTQNQMIDSKIKNDTQMSGMEAMNGINNFSGINRGLYNKIVWQELSAMRAIGRIVGHDETNPLYIATKELNDGQRKMLDWIVKNAKLFEEFTNDMAYMRKITGKHADIIMTVKTKDGEAIMTRGMLISLYMHSTNANNMRHIELGGAVIPDDKLYKAGKISEAYALGGKINMTRSEIVALANEHLSERDFKFAAIAKRYFNVHAKEAINEVSNKLLGYDLAKVGEYFPISVNGEFLKVDFGQLSRDGGVESQGNLKARMDDSKEIDLYDLTTVLNRMIELNGRYIGLAVPVRNMSKLISVATVQTTTDPDGSVVLEKVTSKTDGQEHFKYDDSVIKSIQRKWGTGAIDYIKKMMSDVQGAGNKDADIYGTFADKVRSNYAAATLLINPQVALKQIASYPTAAAVIGWKALMKGLNVKRHVNLDVVSKYTPLLAYRSLGYSSIDLGEIAKRGKHIPKWLDWIPMMDVLTTKRLWVACQYYIEEHKPNLERTTDAYYKAVAEVYNRVIEETQPNYTVMQRPQVLRSKNAFIKQLVMFKTQPMQNFNLIFDAVGNLRAKNSMYTQNPTAENKAALEAAKKTVGRVIASQIVQAAIMAGITFGWNKLIGRLGRYKDDDDELGGWTVARIMIDIVENLGSGIIGETEAAAVLEAVTSGVFTGNASYYGIEAVTPGLLTDLFSAIVDLFTGANKAMNGNLSQDKAKRIVKNAAQQISKVFGIPISNVDNIFKIVFRVFGILGEASMFDGWDK